MSGDDHLDAFIANWDDHRTVVVHAGRKRNNRWPVNVQVSVSPTGRSVRVFVNGEQVHKHTGGPRLG